MRDKKRGESQPPVSCCSGIDTLDHVPQQRARPGCRFPGADWPLDECFHGKRVVTDPSVGARLRVVLRWSSEREVGP